MASTMLTSTPYPRNTFHIGSSPRQARNSAAKNTCKKPTSSYPPDLVGTCRNGPSISVFLDVSTKRADGAHSRSSAHLLSAYNERGGSSGSRPV